MQSAQASDSVSSHAVLQVEAESSAAAAKSARHASRSLPLHWTGAHEPASQLSSLAQSGQQASASMQEPRQSCSFAAQDGGATQDPLIQERPLVQAGQHSAGPMQVAPHRRSPVGHETRLFFFFFFFFFS